MGSTELSVWRPSQCGSGKASYRTQDDAEKALRRIRHEPPDNGVMPVTTTYRCRECRAWHLSKRAPRRTANRAKAGKRSGRRRSRRTVRVARPAYALAPKRAAPANSKPRFSPHDPITPGRAAEWDRLRAELERANAQQSPFPWRNP